jgi:hypothetical protein
LTPAQPTLEEVQSAAAAITERRAELRSAYEQATAALRDRIAEREAAERHRDEILHALKIAHAEASETNKQLKAAQPAAVLAVIGSAATGKLDLKPLRELEPVNSRQQQLLAFISHTTEFFAREAEELLLSAQESELVGASDQITALADMRSFEMELSLVPLTVEEGEVTIDSSVGVTAELRRRAAETRLKASGVHERLSELQKTRRSN